MGIRTADTVRTGSVLPGTCCIQVMGDASIGCPESKVSFGSERRAVELSR